MFQPIYKSLKGSILIGIAVALFVSSALADDSDTAFVLPMDRLQFQATGPGIEIAPVSGDPAGGSHTFFLRLAADFDGFMHTHTASYTAVVISGAAKHWELNESRKYARVMKPGDTFFQKGGVPHQDANVAGETTIIFVSMDGVPDVFPFNE